MHYRHKGPKQLPAKSGTFCSKLTVPLQRYLYITFRPDVVQWQNLSSFHPPTTYSNYSGYYVSQASQGEIGICQIGTFRLIDHCEIV